MEKSTIWNFKDLNYFSEKDIKIFSFFFRVEIAVQNNSRNIFFHKTLKIFQNGHLFSMINHKRFN